MSASRANKIVQFTQGGCAVSATTKPVQSSEQHLASMLDKDPITHEVYARSAILSIITGVGTVIPRMIKTLSKKIKTQTIFSTIKVDSKTNLRINQTLLEIK